MHNSFGAKSALTVGNQTYTVYRLGALESKGATLGRIPYSLRILLENLLRTENGITVTADDIRALARWDAGAAPEREIAYTPARVLLQDFTGVPCVVDLAAMREAMSRLGGDPEKINPLQPVELVIDHSVQVDAFGSEGALRINTGLEFERNRERYAFLKWGQNAFQNFKCVPPSTGIVHQVNLEYLARVVFAADSGGETVAYPDTLVGTDSHTTMINGLGVLGWGVGGIEAEAAMLGQPVSMLIPQVVGFRLVNALPEGATATDLVLTVTQMLRKKGVVGKFVEFYGPGLASLPLADRATLSNMAPEYGATCGIFPVDAETLRYLRMSGRSEEQVALVEAYMKEQGLFHTFDAPEAEYSDALELDLNTVEPSIAGPRRPQDRIPLSQAALSFQNALPSLLDPAYIAEPLPGAESPAGPTVAATLKPTAVKVSMDGEDFELEHGSVVIAAITSCTNTSNPSVMLAAGLVAKKAAEKGLQTRPWVKTSLAPGSRVVTRYLDRAGLTPYLERLSFHTVGYGCTTCIGNSGPLPALVSKSIEEGRLVVCSVLSGNRNFEGRIQSEVRANYLMSPPLVVAYALAGRMDIDLYNEPIGASPDGENIYLRDIWPTQAEVQAAVEESVQADMFRENYSEVFAGDANWNAVAAPEGALFEWNPDSTYIRNPPYFDAMTRDAPERVPDILGARILAVLGDSVTTDHISPAGSIKPTSPAGQYLLARQVSIDEFNSYGSRRGNHEAMVRGTFANIRIKNQLAPGTEGGVTIYLPTGEEMSIYDAAMAYHEDNIPLIVLAGKEYGSGSSRDWAAKGPYLQGVRAVIAESYERIHRSNLVGMGVLPLQFMAGETVKSLGLTGHEIYDIRGLSDAIASGFAQGRILTVRATSEDGEAHEFQAAVRIDTPQEIQYYLNGGILQYVLRQLLRG
ncbi:MAG: aconitate hydratase AcnA [Armatimonadetes bacterium]|nr:aconitate hydratase AcnA [Armatimonadota bacterium]